MTDKRRARAHYAEQARLAREQAEADVVAEAERYTALSAAQNDPTTRRHPRDGERP